ncbi:hypothetical protein HMI54_002819, partial [Coelomomyces lativittatus]
CKDPLDYFYENDLLDLWVYKIQKDIPLRVQRFNQSLLTTSTTTTTTTISSTNQAVPKEEDLNEINNNASSINLNQPSNKNESKHDLFHQKQLSQPPLSLGCYERFVSQHLDTISIDSILFYPIPKIKHCDIHSILQFVEPNIEMDMTDLTNRPLPFYPISTKESKMKSISKVNTWKPSPMTSLNKLERRSKTMETFKSVPYTFY